MNPSCNACAPRTQSCLPVESGSTSISQHAATMPLPRRYASHRCPPLMLQSPVSCSEDAHRITERVVGRCHTECQSSAEAKGGARESSFLVCLNEPMANASCEDNDHPSGLLGWVDSLQLNWRIIQIGSYDWRARRDSNPRPNAPQAFALSMLCNEPGMREPWRFNFISVVVVP